MKTAAVTIGDHVGDGEPQSVSRWRAGERGGKKTEFLNLTEMICVMQEKGGLPQGVLPFDFYCLY